MRKFLLLFLTVSALQLNAAPFKFLPYTITQPNGEKIECYVSGDEFFNWIHDKDGYTIAQAQDGYYYYATNVNGKISLTEIKVCQVKPQNLNIKPWAKISKEEYKKSKQRFELPTTLKAVGPKHAPHTGTLNNIVIYIRFSGESEISTTRETYDNKMNPTSENSLKSYYTEVSYNNFTINSTHYPTCGTPSISNASYQDSHTRGYFQPYNATTNTIGYKDSGESSSREHQLLADAVTWINANSPVDPGINIDADNDGYVDNVCFMIKGNCGSWNDLLWAHRWSLSSKTIFINSKRVWDYTFQPENQVQVTTLCHEMFHALGAPDLYHYDDNTLSPIGPWDIMEYGSGHMSAYMKWKYANANWITTIPEITSTGTYTLNPLTSSTNNCYKIASPNSENEFFVVEYRKASGTFEGYLPGSGLIVYRINSDFEGNASFDNISTFDEVYVYRPNGSTSTNGFVNFANFSSEASRTSITDITNPNSFLHNGLPGGLNITNITSAGSTISFDVYVSSVQKPVNFTATGASQSQINLSWDLNANNNNVLIAYSATNLIGAPTKGVSYNVGSGLPGGGTVIYSGNATSFNHTSLSAGTNYFYRIWSQNNNEYSVVTETTGATQCGIPSIPIIHGFNSDEISPCWSVTTVTVGASAEEQASLTQVKSGTTPDATPYEGTHMIKFNSTFCGAGNVLRLSSPEFSSVGQSQLFVSFAWHRDTQWPQYLDNMTIQWSTDGITWNNGTKYQRYNTSTSWTRQTYQLPDGALNQSNLRIGFLFTSEYGYNCYLDDVRIENSSTGVDEEVNQDNIMIYPNPNKGSFKVKTNNTYKNVTIDVHDICGKLVHKQIFSNSSEASIELANQSKGLYFITIHADGKTSKQKIVVE